jgi:hypothetical protein
MTGFRTIIPIDALDGGLNNKYEPQIIGTNEAQSARNVVFDDLGGVQTRQGFSKLNTAAVNSNPCDGIFTCRWNNGNESMVAFFGTDMFVLSGTTFQTVASAQGNYTTGTHKNMAMYQNLLFIGNGSTPAYKYDEGVYTRHGVEVPSLIADGNVHGAGGNLIGDYNYKLAFVNTQVVAGDLSTASVTLIATAAGETLLLTGLAGHDQSFGINAKWLYRTIAGSGPSGAYYFVASLADTATTYVDNIASASLGSAANTDAGKPPPYEFMIVHQERIFCNDSQNPQYLWYSDLGEPFTFASTNFMKIADGDGEKISGLAVQGNNVVVKKEASAWLVYMPDPTPSNWIRIKSDAKYGCASHRSIVPYEKQVMYLGQHGFKVSGFYAFRGTTTEPDATALRVTQMFGDAKSDRIEPEVFEFQDAYKQNCAAIAFDNKLWFAVTHGAGNTENNRIYHFDFVRRSKSRRVGSWIPFTGIGAAQFTVYSSSLYFGSSAADGFVHQLNDGTYTDNGAAIDSFYETKDFDGGERWRHYDKDFRQANFTVETIGDWDMRFSWRIDSDAGGGDGADFNLNPGGSLWGSMIFGIDDWGGGRTRVDHRIPLYGSGKRIAFKFSNKNTAGSAFKVVRGNIYYNRRGLR